MSQWIAEEKVVFVQPNGTRVDGRIAVAAPVVRKHDCACEVVLEGLERSHTIFGDSTLQALLLGVRFLGMRLHDHQSRGLRVELLAGEETEEPTPNNATEPDIISVLYGPLLRAPSQGDSAGG